MPKASDEASNTYSYGRRRPEAGEYSKNISSVLVLSQDVQGCCRSWNHHIFRTALDDTQVTRSMPICRKLYIANWLHAVYKSRMAC